MILCNLWPDFRYGRGPILLWTLRSVANDWNGYDFYCVYCLIGGNQFFKHISMGNDNKKEQQAVKTQNEIKINHEKFSHFTFHEPEDLIQITLEAQSEKDIKQWDQDLKRINNFPDRENLLLPNKHEYKSKGFCGNVGSVKIFYENYPYLFEQEIENRIEMGKHFEEEELWYLLYSLCSSARDFSKIDSKIGDVRPYNIFINEQGQIKIANLYSWPYERTNFDKTAFEKQLTYLSPEEIRLISKGNHENTTNKVRSESFSIGLTLLQSGLLFNAKELYSVEHYTIDLEKLGQKLDEWQHLEFSNENSQYTSYSPLLRNIVAGLCHPDDKERLLSLQVDELLRPYQNEILNLKEFDHNSIRLPFNAGSLENTARSPPEMVQSRPAPVELNFNQFKGYESMPPQTNLVTIPAQTVYISNPPEPKLNSQPPPPLPYQVTTVESIRPVSANTSVRFNHGQPFSVTNEQAFHGQFNKYATNQVQTAYRPQSIPIQSYEQQFFKYAGMNKEPVANAGTTTVNFNSNTTTTKTFTTGTTGTFTAPPPRTGNTLNQEVAGFSSFNPTFPAANPVPYSREYISSTFTRPITTIETSKVTTSIPVGGNDGSSDFLRKIDEQLEASRRQFPS